MGELVGLKCEAEALPALASRLTRFGPVEGEPEWLTAAAWLVADDIAYVASASVEVLSDGYVARPLSLDSPDAFSAKIEVELPNLAGRFTGRNHGIELPSTVELPPMPSSLEPWPSLPYSTQVLVRIAERAASVHRVACALLFTGSGGGLLLVGTDPSTLAMVISEDEEVIALYSATCEKLSTDDYLARFDG